MSLSRLMQLINGKSSIGEGVGEIYYEFCLKNFHFCIALRNLEGSLATTLAILATNIATTLPAHAWNENLEV